MTQKQNELITAYFIYQISECERVIQSYQNNVRFRKIDTADLYDFILAKQHLEILTQISKDIKSLLKIDTMEREVQKNENSCSL